MQAWGGYFFEYGRGAGRKPDRCAGPMERNAVFNVKNVK